MGEPRIISLETYIGPMRNEFGAAVEPNLDEVGMAILTSKRAVNKISQIDAVVFATCGIRQIFPSGSAAVIEALGLSCQGFDIQAGCASMGVAIEVAYRMEGNILVVSADVLSKTIYPLDPTHIPLRSFGDGAAAMVISHNSQRGHRILAHQGRTIGRWRDYYRAQNNKVVRSLPPEAKHALSDAYFTCWTSITRKLMASCLDGPRIFINQGDHKIFPRLLEALNLSEDHLIKTSHGHAGGADPWIGLQNHMPPKGTFAIMLSSGIGFTFHGLLIEISP